MLKGFCSYTTSDVKIFHCDQNTSGAQYPSTLTEFAARVLRTIPGPGTVDVKPPWFKIVLLTSSIGFCGYLLRRLILRRRTAIDVGTVSENWLAERRGISDDHGN